MPLMKNSLHVNTTAVAATGIVGAAFKADGSKVLSIQAVYTAAAVSATITLQWSNDNTNWENYATATAVSASGAKGWGDIGSTIDAMYWRILYTHTSGASDTFKIYVANIPRT